MGNRECMTVVAALRLWQRAHADPQLYLEYDDAEIREAQLRGFVPLSDVEIDMFCEYVVDFVKEEERS